MILRIRNLIHLINKIWFVLNKRQRLVFVFITLSSFVNAILQTLGISIIVPLVSAMTDSEAMMSKEWVRYFCNIFKINNSAVFFVLICMSTVFLYLFKNIFGIFQLWINAKFSNSVQRELAVLLLKGYMNRDYEFFLAYGTPKIIRDVFIDTQGMYIIVSCFFTVITEMLTMLLILVYIIVMDVEMAACIGLISVICLIIIYKIFRKRMNEEGQKKRLYSAETNKILMESVEGIKEVKVMRKENFFINEFRSSYIKQLKPNVICAIGGGAPTYFIEALFVSGIMLFICLNVIMNPRYITSLPLLASFMMGAVRMLPSLGKISVNVNSVSFYLPSLDSVYNNLSLLMKGEKTANKENSDENQENFEKETDIISFDNQLVLKNISWHYQGTKERILDNLDLKIKKGQAIGIIGASGAGKSTLADIILGLHIPQHGVVELDGRDIKLMPDAYSNIIGFVPQSIYLVDGTIRENVAFGINECSIDDNLIWNCLERSQISDFVKTLEKGINTIVGERGVRFSGGQRQRLAIARALYRKPQILVLDEATSALDNETENEVVQAIENLYGSITMVIIAHRLTTVRKCDVIYEIKDGKAIIRDKSELGNLE
ncbi:ABC transporter ATP-binding protein [Treponema socranskii]|uniref:ABC transporter ATP-binding protein n=1 Tax=Treponema socranskii TaxID=53419 RepID=UPI003D6F3DF4